MSSRTYGEIVAEDRRLVILRTLESSSGYEANESMTAMIVRQFGHGVSRDQIRTDFGWLKEQGLITVEEIATVQIATLTQRGLETAQGFVTTPGVKRPSPQ